MCKILLILFLSTLSLASENINYSASALGRYQNSSLADYNDTFTIQDLTLDVWGEVDNFALIKISASMYSEYSSILQEQEFKNDIRELFIKTTKLKDSEIIVGRFYQDFSILNKLSNFQRPYVFQSTIQEVNFGENGINEVGAGVKRYLLSPWDSYIGFQIFNPDNNNTFGQVEDNKQGLLLTYDNLVKAEKEKKIHIKFSGMYASKKDVSLGNTYVGFELLYYQNEYRTSKNLFLFNYIYTSRESVVNGYYNNIALMYRYKFSKNAITLGYENIGLFRKSTSDINDNIANIQYAYKISKSIGVRAQYKIVLSELDDEYNYKIGLQFRILLGESLKELAY